MIRQRAVTSGHLAVLDGWRGISILCVLAAHLLPLGPKLLQLNEMVAVIGMAMFFTLSGFLITRFLLEHTNIVDFLIRRFARIIPLAWLAMAITLPLVDAPASFYLPTFSLLCKSSTHSSDRRRQSLVEPMR